MCNISQRNSLGLVRKPPSYLRNFARYARAAATPFHRQVTLVSAMTAPVADPVAETRRKAGTGEGGDADADPDPDPGDEEPAERCSYPSVLAQGGVA